MPEFYVRLDQALSGDDAATEDVLDMDLGELIGPDFDGRCVSLGLKALHMWDDGNPSGDFAGMSRDEHDAINADIPPQYREEWDPAKDAWHPASEGADWCAKMISFVEANPGPTEDFPGGLDTTLYKLSHLQKLLDSGAKQGARFQIFHAYY